MSEDWSRQENEAIVDDYLRMLAAEQRGEDFNKTAHRNALTPLLRGRSKGSIERKHMNISAALIELGQPYIIGYKPLPNYQAALADLVADRVETNPTLVTAISAAVQAEASVPRVDDLLSRWERPPKAGKRPPYGSTRERTNPNRMLVNWLEVEARNRSLGKAGEEFVLEFERTRLERAGKSNLADRVEHIAVTVGDGAGFDVRSFELNGVDRLIEVKTTANGKLIPFFLSRNEIKFSRSKSESYYLYRLFRFREDPHLFGLKGSLADTCWMDPIVFSAGVK